MIFLRKVSRCIFLKIQGKEILKFGKVIRTDAPCFYLLKKNLSRIFNTYNIKQGFDFFLISIINKEFRHFRKRQVFLFTVFAIPEKMCIFSNKSPLIQRCFLYVMATKFKSNFHALFALKTHAIYSLFSQACSQR